jgi:hypothetical protein
MNQITLGYFCVHDPALHASDELAAQIAALCVDARWPWQPSLVKATQFPGRPLYPWPKGKVAVGALETTVKDVVRSDDTLGIDLSTGRQAHNSHAWIHLDSGQAEYVGNPKDLLFEGRALCRSYGFPRGKSIDEWIRLMDELSTVTRTPNAVIFANDNERIVTALQYSVGGGPFPQGQHRDVPRYEVARVQQGRRWLGSKYTRPPAWGTYLKREHVEAIGGRGRIVEVVQPPVMRDVGELLYVQLSERAEDAMAADTLARKRAFWELLAPVTVPHVAIG